MYTKKVFLLLTLSLLQDSFALLDELNLQLEACWDILQGNTKLHSLEQINACDSASDELWTVLRCPELHCPNVDECLFGFAKDSKGCYTCTCVADGDEELYEGDIVLDEQSKTYLRQSIDHSDEGRTKRGAVDTAALWKNYKSGDNYQVPYTIGNTIGEEGRHVITAAIEDFARYTCIRLIPRSNQADYINFNTDKGCSSLVGKSKSQPQGISLGDGCLYKGIVIHEIMHSLGFWHEHSRPDRDDYVKIHWENIPEGLAHNFNKVKGSDANPVQGSAYDVGSTMHYRTDAYSINGLPTITDLEGNTLKTQNSGFSQTDVDQVNMLYGCQNYLKVSVECTDGKSTCSKLAQAGWCNDAKYSSVMENICQKSCNSCPTRQNCFDEKSACPKWADAGFCVHAHYSIFVEANCKKSCGLCAR